MDTNAIKRLVRVGIVSSTNPGNGTARVTFPDMDNVVSDELPVLSQGSLVRKHYWIPDVGEQVLCLMLPNTSSNGSNEGFILGAFYNAVDKPVKTGQNIRRYDFGDGSFVEHDSSSGNMTIHATGDVIITGATVRINE